MALQQGGAPPGLIHHSERGVQYACSVYTCLPRDHQIQSSISWKAPPYDNARAESFIKTLKHQGFYSVVYRDMARARRAIGTFLEKTCNRKRLHSALGYRPSAAFERHAVRETIPA